MTREEWISFLGNFAAPDYEGLYVLGCFARYVTFYSQQVRALNLVAGLLESGRVEKESEAAVIGAGAAGLTASAALARHKVRVTVLDELEGPLELQVNNRQRYLHPHIYDWPSPDVEGESANLPVLNWTAGYAQNVVEQLESRWNQIRKPSKLIEANFGVRNVAVARINGGTRVTWNDSAVRTRDFATVIVAVGFGLERHSTYERSYWAEDDIDGAFRRPDRRDRWLVSGYGDGAYTDLMRLCIHRFRHHEVVRLFQSAAGIRGIIKDIETIHTEQSGNPNRLSDCFGKIETKVLEEILRPALRKHGPEVFLTGRTPYPYKPEASILNRLIVLVLSRLNAFSYIPGPTGAVEPTLDGYRVRLAGPDPVFFDRVLLRHGPEPALQRSLNAVWGKCQEMQKNWRQWVPREDHTRKRQWSRNFFGPEVEYPPAEYASPPHLTAVSKYGIRAQALTVIKELQGDGSSRVSYLVEGLKVEDGELAEIRVEMAFTSGRAARPVLDASAVQLGMKWKGDPPPEPLPGEPVEALRRIVRRVAGVLSFPKALTRRILL